MNDVRLLTLVGAGGIGKTRLALQAGEECLPAYRHGICFVNFAPLLDSDAMPSTIARALGLGDEQGIPTLAMLRSYLADRELLLILDNLEHLLAGVPMLAGVLSASHGLNVLATSREPLHLSGERVYVVPPLANAEAVKLFNERALAVQPDWRGSEEVSDICRRVDALPLAVELAAARARVLTPGQILERLERRLSLLTNGPSDAPERQRTLRATIDWSHTLLNAAERDLFARVAVFSGGFVLESAEAVCEGDIDTLQLLVDKSLLRYHGGRFVMLETVREYALEQLESSPVFASTQKLHADYFLSLAEEAAEAVHMGRSDAHWLGVLDSERDNLRLAFDRFVGGGDGDSAQRLVCALFHLWYDRGPASEGAEWTAQALELPSRRALRAATLCRGSLFDVVRGWAEEGCPLAETLGDNVSVTMGLSSMGMRAHVEHQPRKAADLFERALRAARAADDQMAIAKAIVSLLSHNAVEDPRRASALADEAGSLRNLNISMKAMIGMCRGVVAEQAGAEETAMALYRDSLARAQEVNFDRTPAILLNLGWLALRRGDLSEARARLSDAVLQSDARGLRAHAAGGIAYLAVLAAAEGDPLEAAALRGAVEAYKDTVGEPGVTDIGDGTIDRCLDDAKSSVGAEEWKRAFAAGHAMSLGDAIEQALRRRPKPALSRVLNP